MTDARSESDRLQPLLASMLDGRLTDEQTTELREMLASDQKARRRYVRQVATHGMLQWAMGGKTTAGSGAVGDGFQTAITLCDNIQPDAISGFPSVSPLLSPLSPPFIGGPVFSYMVATFVLCAMLLSAWAYKITHSDGEFVGNPKPSVALREEVEFVARITSMTDCMWTNPDTRPYAGSYVPLGRKYELASGLLEITYTTGARVILEGPCSYTVDSDTGGRLQLGKLVARVEKRGERGEERGERHSGLVASAAGTKPQAANPESPVPSPQSLNPPLSTLHSPLFTISTPTAIVTDLGTEFGVSVAENGDTTSHVFRGSVEVRAIGGAAGDRIVIGKNESARVRRDQNRRATVSRHVISGVGGFTCRMPRTVPLDVFNTGVNLREGAEDPHWEIVARSDEPTFESRPAVVTAVEQPWFMPNDSQHYQWISLSGDLPRVPNKVVYTFRTRFELPEIEGQSCNSAVLRCGFMADNHVDAIRFNGRPIEVPEHGRLSPFIRFNVFTVKEGIVSGENVLEFDVSNGGPEEERVEEEGSVSAMALVVELKGFAVYGGLVSEKRSLPLNQPKGKEEVNK